MKKVTEFIYRNERYIIGKKDTHYVAVNIKDIDEKGCLKKSLNGFQLFANEKLSQTLEEIKNHLDIQAYGFTSEDLANTPCLLLDIVNGKYRA